MVKLKHLKPHLKLIKYSFFLFLLFFTSCDYNNNLKNKISTYLGDTKEVEAKNVCIDKIRNYFFAKQCNSKNYEIAIPFTTIDNKVLDVIHLYDLNDVNHFFECSQIIKSYKLVAIFFDKYPDTLYLEIDINGALKDKIFYKSRGKWVEKE